MRRTTTLLLAVALSACLTPPSDEAPTPTDAADEGGFAPFSVPKPDFDFKKIVDSEHGAAHSVASMHLAAHGLKQVGHTGVQSILPATMKGSITQIDVWNGYAVVAGFDGGPAFIIIDVRDPKAPKPISYTTTISYGWSARFSDDGKYVFFGCQVVDSTQYPPQGRVIGDCQDAARVTGSTTAPPMGVSVYNVEDKARPKFVDWVPTKGTHNLQVGMIDGVDIIVTNFADIVEFDREAQKLKVLATVPGRHDSTIVRHPVTQDWLLITGGREIAIYNINDPAEPFGVVEPDQWNEGTGWHEQVMVPGIVDGRVLLAVAGETYEQSSGVRDAVTLVDITNPAEPTMLSSWKPPFADTKVAWTAYTWSVHEMAATPQGQLAVSWYHGGVWVLDISTKERQENPVVVAAFQPHENVNVNPSTFRQTPVPQVPFVWSAGWDQRGYLLIPDMHTGVYVLEPSWGLKPVLDSGT